jgi:hypothetical protein
MAPSDEKDVASAWYVLYKERITDEAIKRDLRDRRVSVAKFGCKFPFMNTVAEQLYSLVIKFGLDGRFGASPSPCRRVGKPSEKGQSG